MEADGELGNPEVKFIPISFCLLPQYKENSAQNSKYVQDLMPVDPTLWLPTWILMSGPIFLNLKGKQCHLPQIVVKRVQQ